MRPWKCIHCNLNCTLNRQLCPVVGAAVKRLFGHVQHGSLQGAKPLVLLFLHYPRGKSQIIHILLEKQCNSWKSEAKISLYSSSWSFPSPLHRSTAHLAVELHSLNTLSTVPAGLPTNVWTMGKGQGTTSSSINFHTPSSVFSHILACEWPSPFPATFPTEKAGPSQLISLSLSCHSGWEEAKHWCGVDKFRDWEDI